MVYKIEWRANALKEFEKLDNSVRIRISKFIDKLKKRDDPKTLGEQLEENLSGYWKYRVGNYRLIADIQDDKLIIHIITISSLSVPFFLEP